jgi:glycosyltransferase involved in cell wall biosynthesis/SAM-dependent methyltransferase
MTAVGGSEPRIGIVVVAYNAASTLAHVLDRIPADFRPRISEVLVCDDHSDDATYLVGIGYKHLVTDLPVTVVRHPRNLGYGGNQKAAYRLASEHGLDIVVLLHGDGQYAPELLPDMVAPLERGECDAVFGSRLMIRGAARKGGMPLYKLLGNRLLTRFENKMLGTSLSEFHSGYRAYRVAVLDQLPLERNSDGFDFDSQIIIQLHEAGKRIVETPIPTFYGDEICYVNGIRYAKDISMEVVRYRLGKVGFGTDARCLRTTPNEGSDGTRPVRSQPVDSGSHRDLLKWLGQLPPSRILELGCSDGELSDQMRQLGHYVCGVDWTTRYGARERLDRFVEASLDEGIPTEVGGGYDVIVAAGVLTQVRRPEVLLRVAQDRLAGDGVIMASIPNFGHWYPRLRTALGRFDYDESGLLARDSVRFFTKRSFERLLRGAGLSVRRRSVTGLSLESGHHRPGSSGQVLQRADRAVSWLWPRLFASEFVFELAPAERKPQERPLAVAR